MAICFRCRTSFFLSISLLHFPDMTEAAEHFLAPGARYSHGFEHGDNGAGESLLLVRTVAEKKAAAPVRIASATACWILLS